MIENGEKRRVKSAYTRIDRERRKNGRGEKSTEGGRRGENAVKEGVGEADARDGGKKRVEKKMGDQAARARERERGRERRERGNGWRTRDGRGRGVVRASACIAQCMHLREVWVRYALVLARACNWVAGSTTSAKAAQAAVLSQAVL